MNSNHSAIGAWKSRVEAHHEQSQWVMPTAMRNGDFWAETAASFRADPLRTDDESLNIMLDLANQDDTVLDVGGGAGRLALPFALKCQSVTVVEPSEGMLGQLRVSVAEHNVENVMMVRAKWEEAEVAAQDFVVCSHVVYGIPQIEDFVRRLHEHATKRVALLSFVNAPQAHIAGLWGPVHGEARIELPALPELVNVLWEMGIHPDVTMIPGKQRRLFDSTDSAMDEMMRRLFIGDNPIKEERLRAALPDFLEDTPDGYVIKGSKPARQGIVHWTTCDA
ncbi:MAG: class I SAM-dependent methyltransferase [SAR202 cluster bacterium]|jgi:SAM-dependent methyltransferase|nr:hypothetical protein [Chloroflexota bacterium]MDP6422377.1 class I SAM-dependent methyltransferase [SAR202 cluster bacterium]MDP6663529.1 class I SAM-dependent methyltransferase [SAR202 cluster bacterium]MDP6800786.1 class I SAM-dependent methyltransferase [SAR202 cluster bacterium]MQG59250.1 class I SAM-dependent methyltransferase [SAR202 cluster bacterium]|tara:strand:- start:3817 stop:4653 length:837 start_codon:yes stop_codon:yes gene_type:complete